ncbi:pyridoxamine 5'-phosphate oxidase family protein [Rhodococcus sp. NPDC019616]|uniref:pyridoxamine 5'-phosphate oxidase family protein n=3 Tax=Rhodococcus TaxID=1827 RepID=UPI00341044E3
MSEMTMSKADREKFLAALHVGVIAVDREGRAPLAVPIWYGYEPGGEVAVWTGRGSLKERLIRAAGRYSLVAQDEAPPYRYVSVEGPATFDESPTADDIRGLATRYLPAEEVDAFVVQSFDAASAVLIRMRPEHWLSVDYGKGS